MAQIAYVTEGRPRCRLCSLPAFGAFDAEFSNGHELVMLCAACAFSNAWSKWHGHMTKKLRGLILVVIFKLPPGDPVEPPVPLADHFEPSNYNGSWRLGDQRVTADLGYFATEWAALERARQVSHRLAIQVKELNHWAIQTAVHRNGDHHETPTQAIRE